MPDIAVRWQAGMAGLPYTEERAWIGCPFSWCSGWRSGGGVFSTSSSAWAGP